MAKIDFSIVLLAFLLASPLAAVTYNVGPGQPLASIGAVPWATLAAGDFVRIHYRAAPYAEKWVICRQGTQALPIIVQGVPDVDTGALPVITGASATTAAGLNFWGEKRGLLKIGGANTPADTVPQWIVIENLEFRSAHPGYTFTDDTGTPGQVYAANAAGIYVEKGKHLTFRNCTVHDCGNGIFVGPGGGADMPDLTEDITISRCYIHGNGISASAFEHNSYCESFGILYEFNRYGPPRAGANGNALKDRSAGCVVRYNWIEGGNRQLDLVEADGSGINTLAGYGTTHVYGNVLIEPDGAGNSQIIHYGGDSGTTSTYRKGTLHLYGNTIVSNRAGNTTLIRLSTNSETCDCRNNIIYVSAAGSFLGLVDDTGLLNYRNNWFKTGFINSHSGTPTGTVSNLGGNVVGTAPSFLNEAGQDFALAGASTCINAGTALNAAVLPTHNAIRHYVKHQQDSARPVDATFDIGAYELGTVFIPDALIVTAPNGGEIWTVGSIHDITWTWTGTIANVNIDYSTDSGGSWIPVVTGTANDGSYNWTVPSTPSTTCLVRVRDAANAATSDSSDAVFTISAAAAETVSSPSQPVGANMGQKAVSYPFTTGGSTSSLGHTVQYKFDWDDGSDSGWLTSGTTGASHSWAVNGTYDVKAMARCVTHTAIESLWSEIHAIIISDSGTLGKYNSPSQLKVLPEVIWAAATGGGTWMSEVQITDISGGSQVSVYYNTGAGRRGPFLLWNNSSGALHSQKYNNMLQTIDGLDSGVFTYYGTVGAVEFVTQDAAHVLQVMARTLNGSYSKTFPAFSLHDSNTVDTSRVMNITNLTSNSTYRSTVGFFNPTADAVTVELKLLDAANAQIGTTITKTVNGYGFSAFFPFNDAGVAYPANSFDNVILEVRPVSGTGKVLCFGASANNATNDPAAHIAVQNSTGHDNGPSSLQILPEAIWAAATGGGTWMSETQIVDVTGGSAVSVYFEYGGGSRRGPFVLWTGGVAGSKVKYANILQQIGTIDSGFTYYGRVGSVEFYTQDVSHTIQVTARTLNGNYSKTFPGLNLVDSGTADKSRIMLIQNYSNNSTYRSTCGFFNPTADAVTVEFTLLNGSGAQIGAPFSKTFVGYDYQAFFPFNEAGVPYPANSYDNVILRVRPTSGTGQVVCFGASANNASNDPAAHLAVQGQ